MKIVYGMCLLIINTFLTKCFLYILVKKQVNWRVPTFLEIGADLKVHPNIFFHYSFCFQSAHSSPAAFSVKNGGIRQDREE